MDAVNNGQVFEMLSELGSGSNEGVIIYKLGDETGRNTTFSGAKRSAVSLTYHHIWLR